MHTQTDWEQSSKTIVEKIAAESRSLKNSYLFPVLGWCSVFPSSLPSMCSVNGLHILSKSCDGGGGAVRRAKGSHLDQRWENRGEGNNLWSNQLGDWLFPLNYIFRINAERLWIWQEHSSGFIREEGMKLTKLVVITEGNHAMYLHDYLIAKGFIVFALLISVSVLQHHQCA